MSEEGARSFFKLLLGAAAVVYVISPVDLLPGLQVDDIAVAIMAIASARSSSKAMA
jgi:uncharacterized membrane protein YkvA (DUF1232 family)